MPSDQKERDMKNRFIVILVVLLIVSMGNYSRIIADGSIRNVEFLSIFVIGVLSGILLTEIIKRIKGKQ